MALSNGNLVSPHLVSGTVKAQPQPPKFGIVDDESGVDVLWEDGRLQTGITNASLDNIEPPASNVLTGQRVIVNVSPGASFQQSSDYEGLVVLLFKRDRDDGGSPTADLALVKLLSSGLYLEVLASQVTVVGAGT